MRPQTAIRKLGRLLRAHKFTSKEAKRSGVTAATLAYYAKHGELERIGHGIYRGIHAPKTKDFRWEDLIDAVQRAKGGVICLISALALYDLTEEIPRQHWIAIRNETIHRTSRATRVVRMRNLTLGQTTLKIGKITVPIFDRERTIVDSFRFLPKEVAIKALKRGIAKRGDQKISAEKLLKYAKALRVKIETYLLAVTT